MAHQASQGSEAEHRQSSDVQKVSPRAQVGLVRILILVSDLSSTQKKLQALFLHPPAECQDTESSSNGFGVLRLTCGIPTWQ